MIILKNCMQNVFVKMIYDNGMWHMVTNTRGVTGFVGPQGRPLPLTEEEVKKMQQKLKNWGYYKGAIDGIYGSQTKEAVRYFQRRNNLVVDGIAGPKTLSAMGINGGSSSSSSSSAIGWK